MIKYVDNFELFIDIVCIQLLCNSLITIVKLVKQMEIISSHMSEVSSSCKTNTSPLISEDSGKNDIL